MTKYVINDTTLNNIANQLRAKIGGHSMYTPSQIAEEISTLKTVNDELTVFNQVNDTAAAYLAHVNYSASDYSSTAISDYADYTNANAEKPKGYSLTVEEAGTAYFLDESTGNGWKTPVLAGTYTVYNLVPGHIYRYWMINADGETSANGRLKPTGALRMLYLSGGHNTRDIGGLACDGGVIKYGAIFRGSQLTYGDTILLNASDINSLHNACGIRCELDLRTDNETGGISTSILGADVEYVHYAITYSDYTDIVDLNGNGLQATVNSLNCIMDSVIAGKPIYIHCAASADRTGVICCLLEAIAGVAQTDCDIEYELTAFYAGLDYTDRTRNSSNWRSLISYLNTFSGDTFRDRVLSWFVQAGISIDKVNGFRAAISSGIPENLTYETAANQLEMATDALGNPYNGGAGYISGYRLNSSGTESAASGMYVTGFIPVAKGQTITFVNIHADTANNNNCYLTVYDSGKNKIASNYVKDWYSLAGNTPKSKDSNNWMSSITLKYGINSANIDNTAYFRLSALYIDSTSEIYVE